MNKKVRLKNTAFIGIGIILIVILCYVFSNAVTEPVFSSNAKAKYLVVVSVDALNSQDFETIKGLPNFSKLINSGSYAKEVVGVYPSLTYPSHTTIITGAYPDKHGIFTNEVSTPGTMTQPWYWYRKDIKVETLYDVARNADMKTAAIFWPVTAGAKIDYNCPEIWPVKDGQSQIVMSAMNGSIPFLLHINSKFGSIRDGSKQPQLDDFTTAATADLIETRKPNLTLMHLTELDHVRHKHGFMSQEAKDVLTNMDQRLGKIIDAVDKAGIEKDTTIIVLGDHGFADFDYKICLNAEFSKQGLISVDPSGKVTDWKAYANYCDGSAQISIKNPKDTETIDKVQKILGSLSKDSSSGIEAVYNKEQAAKKRVTGDFEFMVEAKSGYYFSNEWQGDLIVKIDKTKIDENDGNSYLATHGYDPLKPNYRTFFMASGAGIKKGVVLDSIEMIDEGPTMAKLLGLYLPEADGKSLDEIIEN